MIPDLHTVFEESCALSLEIAALLRQRSMKITFAESCTAGLLSAAFCSVSGASEVFDGSVVTYANEMKNALLGVPDEIFASVGAVSRECACFMASGAAERFHADIALSVTGIAGPSGGTPEKPVGTVWIGCFCGGSVSASLFRFEGDRQAVRAQSVRAALQMGLQALRA